MYDWGSFSVNDLSDISKYVYEFITLVENIYFCWKQSSLNF